MYELVGPIATVVFSEVPNEAFLALACATTGTDTSRDGPRRWGRHRPRWCTRSSTTTLLREHRGDGHNAALVAHGIGGTECHVLLALSLGMRAEEFGRVHHLPTAQPAAVVDGLRGRGHVDATDELDELIAGLEPIAAAVSAADD